MQNQGSNRQSARPAGGLGKMMVSQPPRPSIVGPLLNDDCGNDKAVSSRPQIQMYNVEGGNDD